MVIEQIYTGCLAQGAYYIESDGEAAVIDPLREPDPYIERAARSGAKIKYIFETHFHADFVSGHLDLAKKTGATIVYGPNAQTEYEIYQGKDGERFQVGKLTIELIHTPGHTLESSCYLLYDEQGKPHALFSGDTLFIGDVGRPDLAQKRGVLTKEDLAGMLFDSLRNKIMPLPDDVIVYPAHGAGSACGKNMSKETWDTLGNQKKTNYALQAQTREEFIQKVTEGLLPPPAYFAKNAQINKKGYKSYYEVMAQAKPLSVEAFETAANETGAVVLDVRDKYDFARGFIPNSIFIGLDGQFAPWVGALIPDLMQPILVVAPQGREKEAVRRLSRVGFDNTIGYLEGGFEAWQAAGKEVDRLEYVSAAEFAERLKKGMVEKLLDVRKPTEFQGEHVEGALNFPLDFINQHMHELHPDDTYYVHCRSGYRSTIAASILKSRGFDKIVDIIESFDKIKEAGVPVTDYVCPSSVGKAPAT